MEPSELDANTIRHMCQRQGSRINAQKLCKKIEAIDNHEHDFDFSDLLTMSQKGDGYLQKAAKYILMRAYVDKFGDSAPAHEMVLLTVRSGCLSLMQRDRYYRFEPCIRRMFELNAEKTQKLVNLYDAYMQSKHRISLDQSFHKLKHSCDGIPPASVSENADEINSGLESYNHAMDVVERGLPLLTGFKRILDANDELDLDKLQKLRLRSMIKELTNSENYCYFDQVVDIIDLDIRNAIAHGDTFVNPSESIVEFPNAGTNHQFSTMSNKLEDIYAISIFLSGTYQHNMLLSAILEGSELDQWDILPTHSEN